MSATENGLATRLSNAVGAEVRLEPVSETESRVFTPFRFPDGDHLVVRLQRAGQERWAWTDTGHTFMHLSYDMDVDALDSGPRARLLEETLRRFGVEDRGGELVLESSRELLGGSLLQFAQALIQVSDLRFLSRERVQSTFKEDFRVLMADSFGTRARFDYVDPDHDPNARYPVDCLVNGTARPLAVFALGSDSAVDVATIGLLQFKSWGRRIFSAGVFEDQEERNRKAVARFSDVVDKQFSTLHGNESDIVEYLREQLGEAAQTDGSPS